MNLKRIMLAWLSVLFVMPTTALAQSDALTPDVAAYKICFSSGSARAEDRAARYVTNPGYTTPPTTTQYYYPPRDAYRTDDVTATDIGLNYSFKFRALGTDLEIFVQPEGENVFNEQAVTNPNQGAEDRGTGYTNYADFNPFTETPVEGVHWAKGPLFGQADDPFDYQQPRTFRVSVGFRF